MANDMKTDMYAFCSRIIDRNLLFGEVIVEYRPNPCQGTRDLGGRLFQSSEEALTSRQCHLAHIGWFEYIIHYD